MYCRRLVLVVLSLASVLAAEEKPSPWKATRLLAAPEAHQAAACDERFIYAITSRLVAKYDRQSGKRLARSTGPAKHLNSGFVWQGKLLCAHSNYPLVPEKSSIRILDPDSMKLTTWKDFGDYGGSLTWVVRWKKSWWCNFAKYGKDNHKTFLVKFDDQWKEQQRYTYPKKVIAKLGRYSLSGGTWYDDRLLVTGHDDPVVFRLQLPEKGRELRLVDEQIVPFTGQGIANDPTSAGLIGISRAKRQTSIIFAKQ